VADVFEDRCVVCEDPQLAESIAAGRAQGMGYKAIWRRLKASGAMVGRNTVQAHCGHAERTIMTGVAEAADRGAEVGDEWFVEQGVNLPPEGTQWVAATVEQVGPGGERHWVRVRPVDADAPEQRVEIRQAQPVEVVGRPTLTVFSPGDWRTWIANPDPQIGYWKHSDGRFIAIHDERAFSLGHQIAWAASEDDNVHGWIDAGDFVDLAAPSRHHPTAIDLHVENLNRTWQRGCEELARRRALVGEEGEVVVMAGNHDCLDANTRAVTKRGFMSVEDITSTDEVLTVDDAGNSVWVKPTAIIRRPYQGEMVRIQSHYVDAVMTPNHRVVGKRRGQEWWESAARDVWTDFSSVVSGGGSRDDHIYSDWDIRMAVWCHTDSHCRRQYRIRDSVTNKNLSELVPDKDQLAPWVWDLSERQVDLLVDEWVYTDGTMPTRGKSKVIYCSRHELRRQLMTLMVANGYRVTEHEYSPGYWRINGLKTGVARVSISDRRTKETYAYDGEVWCLTVPHERFFVERSGKVFLTGNCRLQSAANKNMPYLVGMRRADDPDDEAPVLTPQYLMRARDYSVEWIESFPASYRRLNSNLVVFHSPAYGSKALDTARKVMNKIHASVYLGHIHRREALAENIETTKGARTMEVWSDGTWARIDGSLPGANSSYDSYGNRLISGPSTNKVGVLGPSMQQGMSIIHVEQGGRERFSVERVAFWDGWAQWRGHTFEAGCDEDGNA
jgi:hypothetical protein